MQETIIAIPKHDEISNEDIKSNELYNKGFIEGVKFGKGLREVREETYVWHHVTEKLPEKKAIYFVTVGDTEYCDNNFTDFCEYYPDKKQFGFNGEICEQVIAWMDLPEPYKVIKLSDLPKETIEQIKELMKSSDSQ